MKNFYIIYNLKNDIECNISYATFLKDGIMMSSNLYDATKFDDEKDVHEYLNHIKGIFKDLTFGVLEMDKIVFGNRPKNTK